MNVCWISNAPSPYKVELMNLLGHKMNLLCLFETRAESDREKSWYSYDFSSFQADYLNEGDAKQIIRKAAKFYDCLIDSDYSSRICMYAVRCFHKQKKPVFLHADGGLAIPRGLVDKAISFVMKHHDYAMSSGMETDKYFRYYGFPAERIFHYHMSCMSEAELKQAAAMRTQKEDCRKQCSFQEPFILLSVGQQIPRKGYDILAQAMADVPEEIGLYIAGGQPEPSVSRIIAENHLSNVHFIPFRSKEDLKFCYAGADVFVLPTRYDIWGLVINEAMAFGLPVISTDRCVAAMEFSSQADNAVIVPSEHPDLLSKAIQKLYEDPDLRNLLAERSLEGIRSFSLEQMAEDFEEILERGLSGKHQ